MLVALAIRGPAGAGRATNGSVSRAAKDRSRTALTTVRLPRRTAARSRFAAAIHNHALNGSENTACADPFVMPRGRLCVSAYRRSHAGSARLPKRLVRPFSTHTTLLCLMQRLRILIAVDRPEARSRNLRCDAMRCDVLQRDAIIF